jgi:hypothetical protein
MEIVEDRYGASSTLITSQLPVDAWQRRRYPRPPIVLRSMGHRCAIPRRLRLRSENASNGAIKLVRRPGRHRPDRVVAMRRTAWSPSPVSQAMDENKRKLVELC